MDSAIQSHCRYRYSKVGCGDCADVRHIVSFLIGLLLVSTTATATVYYVSPSGSDGANGLTEGTAWLSLDNGNQFGIMLPGDTVLVLPGTYNLDNTYELTQSGTSDQPIVYHRFGKGEVRMEAGHTVGTIVRIDADHVELDGFCLLNSLFDALYLTGDSCRVLSSYVGSSGQCGIRNIGNHNLFYRNVICSAGEDGIKNDDVGSLGNRYYHNTIHKAGRDGINIGSTVSDCRIVNCIVTECTDNGISGSAGTVCAFNNVWGNLNGNYNGTTDSAGGISSAPHFVDPNGERFDLRATAGEINAGLDLGLSFNGSAPDIGAFEKYNTYFVSPSGDDTHDGVSLGTAWATIDNGDSLLYPGDTVYILAGTYPDSVILSDSGLSQDPVCYAGVRDSSILQGTWNQAVRLQGQYLRISGLTVSGAGQSGFHFTGDHNRLYECHADSCGEYGANIVSGEDNIVVRSLFTNQGSSGILVSVDSFEVWNCTFFNNDGYGVDAAGQVGLSVRNSVFSAGESTLAGVRSNSSGRLRYSLFYDYASTVVGGISMGIGCFEADPQLMAPAAGSFRLLSSSPAIDAGEDLGLDYTGLATDLGAYETNDPVSIAIAPVIDSMFADSLYQFSVAAIDSLGYPANYGSLLWDHSFATGEIDSLGLFTPQLIDTASISVVATNHGLVDTTLDIHIVPGNLASLDVSPIRDTISADSSRLFTASGSDSRGNSVTDLGTLSWSVVNKIGTVDDTGLFMAHKIGAGFIQAVSDYGVEGTTDTITVVSGEVAFIDVQPSENVVPQGDSYQYSALGFDSDSNVVVDVTNDAHWTTTDFLGDVDSTGLYSAGVLTLPGDYRVHATWNTLTDSGLVSVVPSGALHHVRIEYEDGAPVTDTSLSADNDSTVVYARGYNVSDGLLGDVSCTWSIIGNDSIGSVSPTTGTSAVLQLSQLGTGSIVAEYAADKIDTSGTITCTAGVAAQLLISPDSATTVNADSQLVFVAEFHDTDGNLTTHDSTITWGVLGGIGTVDAAGLFSPAVAGSGSVYATAGLLADTSASVTVTPGTLVSIQVTPDSATVSADSTLAYTAVGYDSENNVCDPGLITWQLTDAVGDIDSTGLFDAVTAGSATVIATSDLGPADTTSLLEVYPGVLHSLSIAPDSIEIPADSTAVLTANAFDADGNAVDALAINWRSLNGLSVIDESGSLNPHTVGTDRIMAFGIVTNDTVADTNTAVVITPGTLHRLSVSPNTATLGIGDSLQFSTTGYDSDFNVTGAGTIDWSVSGDIGAIDSTGLLVAESAGFGQVTATDIETDITATTDLITVEALQIDAETLSDFSVQPGTVAAVLLKCRVTNSFDRSIAIDELAVNAAFSGAGTAPELLANVDSLLLYIDGDDDSQIGASDSLIATVSLETNRAAFVFDSIVIPSASEMALVVAASVSTFARDSDTLDLFVVSETDIGTVDGSVVEASDTLNSHGLAVTDGMVADQLALTMQPTDSVWVQDSPVHLATLDIPRNGYEADVLQVVSLVNAGSVSEADLDSLILFADDGNGVWDEVDSEQRIARLVYTGSYWIRSGLAVPLTDQHNRFYLTAWFADYPQSGASLRFTLPQSGISVASGNDGPLDTDVVATDSILIFTDHQLEIQSLDIPSRDLIPGEISGPLLGLNMFNGTQTALSVQTLTLDVTSSNPGDATQAQLDSQIDSVSLYISGDTDYGSLSDNDTLVASSQVVDGKVTFSVPGISVGGSGSMTTILVACWLSETEARDGNTVGLALADLADLEVAPNVEISATFPLANSELFAIDAFPHTHISFAPTGNTTVFGGDTDKLALVLHVPANGYTGDTLNSVHIANLGTLDNTVITRLTLFTDAAPVGVGPEDSLLAVLMPQPDEWRVTNLGFPVPVGGAAFYLTADISSESFEGGTLQLAVPQNGLVYRSGMVGPDDAFSSPDEEILVFPPDRVTAVSIPLATSVVHPGAQDNSLITFALYNGYAGQSHHLTRVTLTNTSRSLADDQWADQEVGQVKLYYDHNGNRILDDDLLVGTGLFEDRRLTINGMNVEIPPEALSYFFAVATCPLSVIDGDSLSAAVNSVSDFSFSEQVSINGDIPLTRGGFLVIDGSVSAQYQVLNIVSRSLSPNDSNVVLYAFEPALNGNQTDTLTSLILDNALDADHTDLQDLRLWQDVNLDRQWQPTDELVGSLSYSGGVWTATGLAYEVDALSSPLLVTATVTDTAGSGKAFRGLVPVGGCSYSSGNDGPIDAPVVNNATFTISSSALQIQYEPMRTTYSVGEPITLALNAVNRFGSELDSVLSLVSIEGDTSAIVSDSVQNGPIAIASDDAALFHHYFTGAQPGSVNFQAQAIASTIADSSGIIESDQILIQSVPSGLNLSLHGFMPTAVARGQLNVFPLSLRLSHADLADAAAIAVQTISISVLDGLGVPQPANAALSRLLLANTGSPLATLTDIPGTSEVSMNLSSPLILHPSDTAEIVLLVDISDSASATDLMLGIESVGAVVAVDDNTGNAASLIPTVPLPVRTASCRIDDPSQTLALSNVSQPLSGVNAGQQDVALLGVGLRHPGVAGMSQAQVVGVSLTVLSGSDTLEGSLVASRIGVYRSSELLGEATGTMLDATSIPIDLGAGLTLNPNSRDSLIVRLSIAPDIVYDSFRVVLADSLEFEIRDAVSGSDVIAVTDEEILTTGSVFPLSSSTVTVYQPTRDLKYCLSTPLPATVVVGSHDVSLVSLSFEHAMPPDYSAIRLHSVSLLVIDSSGTPLDPGQLFDRAGYRIDAGATSYYSTLSLSSGATVFPLTDTGLLLEASDVLDLELVVDIESDCPYDNFQIVLNELTSLDLRDAVDVTSFPAIVAAISCETTVPYESPVTSIFRPAGSPQMAPDGDIVRIAYSGQSGLTIGRLDLSYDGAVEQGDVEFVSLQAKLYRRSGASHSPVPVSDVFSRLYLVHEEVTIAEDSLYDGETCNLAIDPSMVLSYGTFEEVELRGDVVDGASLGNYRVEISDSTDIVMLDRNLGTPIYPALSFGTFPVSLGTVSISEQGLAASFSNYPNPFVAQNGPTTIAYVLPEEADVDIEIFTVTGEPVAQIAWNETRSAGPHQDQTWDGYNDVGLKVVSGTYFCRITAHYHSGRTETARRKVSVIR